ncbi:MAG TPA: Stf0 family sulfotransferase [Streptosporangiaceae bacterium]|nr:Stf0 family sulfotransferase [Streptosporangiaceae bacterium]
MSTTSATARAGETNLSCLIATTPWSGSRLLCGALRATGLAGDPRDYFNPFEVVRRGEDWGVLGSEGDFAVRYLTAAGRAATGDNGVLSVNLPWSHQRWLVRVARAALPASSPAVTGSDAEVLEVWYPRTHYLYLTSDDKARQAIDWYLGRPEGPAPVGGAPQPGEPPDFQEIRWIESLISRQEQAWETYFQMHGIEVHRVRYETFLERPGETVAGILQWLELPGPPSADWAAAIHQQRLAGPVDWLEEYLAERDWLSETIGVRQGGN